MKKRDRRVRSEDTAIVVSVKHSNQGPIEKLFKSTNIGWKPVERQLLKWSNLVRLGRTPQVAITFKYIRDDTPSVETSFRPAETSLFPDPSAKAPRHARVYIWQDRSLDIFRTRK